MVIQPSYLGNFDKTVEGSTIVDKNAPLSPSPYSNTAIHPLINLETVHIQIRAV